ncbi:MAG TPA: response regulator [Anaerohalosphaeraceae bacterium]|jgi:two-component system chemotaxis response regulator CheY|nr:response regulator [Anaerohalosphaeraceae bacterium]HRT52126.1 response regulator [Anaerohalosphaeraceae bacterium]HRT87970.1 response regulator [Anaerohalosphaeraceae bacterium]
MDKKVKSLVVDDDPASTLLLKLHLEEYGPCQTTDNGDLAVHAYRSGLDLGDPYDLVCLDINMPQVSGHEVLQRIRQAEKEYGVPPEKRPKVIMVTAMGDVQNITAAHRSGCDGYIIKPIVKDNLEKELRRLGILPPGSD